MAYADMPDPSRVDRSPDGTVTISGRDLNYGEGLIVHKVELRRYDVGSEPDRDAYSLITSMVSTSLGDVEMVYDEGRLGEDALEEAKRFLEEHVGPGGLILRSIVSIRSRLG